VVQGHVDGVGRLLTLRPVAPDNEMTDWWLEVGVPVGIRRYVVEKGSIAIEGISLTVAAWDGERASVAIIPHTYQHTNLRIHEPGDLLNLEADVLLRHAAQIGAAQIGATRIGATQTLAREKSPELTLAFLITNGY
jgi:riboflavin synthase